MYSRSEPIIPKEITKEKAIETIFTIGEIVEVDIFTIVNAICIMEKFLNLNHTKVYSCIYSGDHAIYKIPTKQYYSNMLAYTCLMLSSKYYEWYLVIDLDENYGYEDIGSEYIYKMELDIFFSIQSASILEKDYIFLPFLAFSYWWYYSKNNINVSVGSKICIYLLDLVYF